MSPLARLLEALLFLAPEPVSVDGLADAAQADEEAVRRAEERFRGAFDNAPIGMALLELHRRGEAAWEQDEPFGPITVRATVPPRRDVGAA